MSNPFALGTSATPIIPAGMTTAEFDAQTRVPEVLWGSIIPFGVATIFVIARFYSRLILIRSWGQDDTWISISWVGAIVLTILNCLFTLYGTGRHITVQKPQWVTPSLKVSYCVRLVYLFVLATTKIGVLALYQRVFDDRKTRNIIRGMMAAVVLYTTPVILMYLFQCRPIYGVWESSIEKTCLNTDTIIYVAAGCSIALDIALVVVAIPRILPLKLPRTQKAALLAIASLSILVIIAAIIRFVRVTAIASSKDYTWDSYDVTTWSAVEVDVGLICAAAPTIRPLIRAVTGITSSTSSNPTYLSHSMYGTGTRSRAIELSNGEGFNATRSKNAFWTSIQTELSDGESTKGVLDQSQEAAEEGGIMRTVVIRINRDNERIDADSEKEIGGKEGGEY